MNQNFSREARMHTFFGTLLRALIIWGSVSFAFGQSSAPPDSAAPVKEPANIRLAVALSVFVPGLGNVYGGEPVRGLVHFATAVGAATLISAAKIGDTGDSIKAFGWISVCTFAAAYLWSLIDCAFINDRSAPAPTVPRLEDGRDIRNQPPGFPQHLSDARVHYLLSLQIPL
jgi:hypothetical protein